jgi:hypothetical protein
VPSGLSSQPLRALTRFALSLFSFLHGALALLWRAEPLKGLARPRLDPRDLLEHADSATRIIMAPAASVAIATFVPVRVRFVCSAVAASLSFFMP